MSKAVLLRWTNILILASFLLQAGTGILMMAAAPMDVGDFHAVNGVVFTVLALAHLALNWPWVKANFFRSHV